MTSTLKELADRVGLEIATGLFYNQILQVPPIGDVCKNESHRIVLDWDLFWKHIEPIRGQTQYENETIPGGDPAYADQFVDWALSNGLKVRGQHLLWHHSYPDWLLDLTDPDEIKEVIRRHIIEVMCHFGGKIDEWVVVNEAGLPGSGRTDFLFDKLGVEYIDFAFEIARATDPSAKLIYNDSYNHVEEWPFYNISKEIVDRLVPQGLIDGLGMQMHLNVADVINPSRDITSWQQVIDAMQSFDLPIYITELDMNLKDLPESDTSRFYKQAEIYGDLMDAALQSDVCESFTLFFIGDKYSWIELTTSYGQHSPIADPTVYDDDINPKPAYYELRNRLCLAGV